jgi:hypothetical protein
MFVVCGKSTAWDATMDGLVVHEHEVEPPGAPLSPGGPHNWLQHRPIPYIITASPVVL